MLHDTAKNNYCVGHFWCSFINFSVKTIDVFVCHNSAECEVDFFHYFSCNLNVVFYSIDCYQVHIGICSYVHCAIVLLKKISLCLEILYSY